jgi:hypothetical protein
MSPQEAEMRSSISAWLKCPSEKRPSAAALGQRIAEIAAQTGAIVSRDLLEQIEDKADDPPEGDGWRPIAPGFPKPAVWKSHLVTMTRQYLRNVPTIRVTCECGRSACFRVTSGKRGRDDLDAAFDAHWHGIINEARERAA